MKKLIVTTIIAGLIFGCSKENTSEPIIDVVKPPVDTTIVNPAKDSLICQIVSLKSNKKANHYVYVGDTVSGRINVKVDSLKIVFFTDSINYQFKFFHMGNWTTLQGNNTQLNVLQKIVWKKF